MGKTKLKEITLKNIHPDIYERFGTMCKLHNVPPSVVLRRLMQFTELTYRIASDDVVGRCPQFMVSFEARPKL